MRHWTVVAGASLALAFVASADAATIVFEADFGPGVTEFGSHALAVPRYDGPGTITDVDVRFEGITNQYRDVFGGDEPIVLPPFDVSWIMGLEGPGVDIGGGVIDFQTLDETVVEATYPEFEVPAGAGETFTRFTPFVDFTLQATDTRFDLYQGTGFNEFNVYAFGDVVIQAGGKLTVTITTADPVPEPATWALMLLGFGGAGAWLRRRRAAAA